MDLNGGGPDNLMLMVFHRISYSLDCFTIHMKWSVSQRVQHIPFLTYSILYELLVKVRVGALSCVMGTCTALLVLKNVHVNLKQFVLWNICCVKKLITH
jgi:hypothetical protein